MKVNTLKLTDNGYPEMLRQIASPPKQLFWSGLPVEEWLQRPKLAVVGSRKASPYGIQTTQFLVQQLARYGVVVISGLAFGIDSVAHKAALEAGATTAAVMPAGLDQIYPVAHRDLAHKTIEQGTLISEYPLGAELYKQNFIARNRLISGLADAVLVIEAARGSGSLHTARFGLEQGKTVMAVPGNIDRPGHEGCNNLIKAGALLVSNPEDIVLALGLTAKSLSFRLVGQSPLAEQVFALLKKGIKSQDELLAAARIPVTELSQALTSLEIGGYIRAVGAGQWITN